VPLGPALAVPLPDFVVASEQGSAVADWVAVVGSEAEKERESVVLAGDQIAAAAAAAAAAVAVVVAVELVAELVVAVAVAVAAVLAAALVVVAELAAVAEEAVVEEVVAVEWVVEQERYVLDGSWLMVDEEVPAGAVMLEVLSSCSDCDCSAENVRAASQWLGPELVAAASGVVVAAGALLVPVPWLRLVVGRLAVDFAFAVVVAGSEGAGEG
jgi:hypothetical protein